MTASGARSVPRVLCTVLGAAPDLTTVNLAILALVLFAVTRLQPTQWSSG